MEYIAYLHKDRDSDYGVSSPDFPGCIAGRVRLYLSDLIPKGERICCVILR